MIRIKRLLSSFIDFVIIFMGMDVFHTYLLKGVTSKNTIEIIFNVIFLIFTFILWISKDLTFQKHSIGKALLKLTIIDERTNSKISNKKIIVRNFISLLTLPISIFSVIVTGKTIGDIFFKTLVVDNSRFCQKREIVLKNQEKIKASILGKIILIGIAIILTYVFIIYLFFQKLNYYSLRNIISIIIILLVLIINLFFIKKKGFKKFLIIFFLALFIIIEFYNIPFENNFIKNKEVIESFNYNFPRSKLIKQYNFENSSCMFTQIDDYYDNYCYNKNNQYWPILSANVDNKNIKKIYKNILTSNSHSTLKSLYRVYINFVDNNTIILIQSNVHIDKITDSIGSEFENYEVDGLYYWELLLSEIINKEYSISIDGEIYYPLK